MKKRIFIIFLLICLLYAIQSCDDEESNASYLLNLEDINHKRSKFRVLDDRDIL